MDNSLKLGMCLPTNNPTQYFEGPSNDPNKSTHATLMNGSMDSLMKRAVLLFNFQRPWTDEQAEDTVNELRSYGWEVRYQFTSGWDKPIKFIAIRGGAAELGSEDCDVFMLMDDDMYFTTGTPKQHKTSGDKYVDMLSYFQTNPECGMINAKGFLGGYGQGNKIKPVWDDMYSTGKGTMFRNVSKSHSDKIPSVDWHLAPPVGYELRGALEETLLCYTRMELGYWPAKTMNVPTVHPPQHITESLSDDDMHHPDVISSNVQAWIRDHYQASAWTFESRKVPNSMKLATAHHHYALGTVEEY